MPQLNPIALDPVPRPLDHLVEMGDRSAPALVLKSETLTYGDLAERVGALGGWLMKHASYGQRVASWAAKGELTCLLPLAAARAGLVHVPINPLLKSPQAAHILADSGSVLLLGTASRIKSLDDTDVPDGCVVLSESEVWEEIAQEAGRLPPSGHDPNDLAAILYTSGSTGRPKGVMLSHANMWLGAVSVAHYLGMAADDRTLAVLPLSFDYGQSQLLSTWIAGGCVIPINYLFPRDVVKACAAHGVTTLAAVPPLWVQLVESEWPEDSVAGLRRITNSGGALTEELIRKFRQVFPDSQIFPMYGLTEAFRSTFLDPKLVATHPTSMGKAIPFAEILVVNDEGDPCQAGEEGELVHCGPLVAQGYWEDSDRTAERFRPAPNASQFGGLAVWSGDRVRRDEQGLLYFVGRRDAMIKTSGNRVSPQEVESVTLSLESVIEAVALGVPDERLGHAIHLIVRGDRARGEETLKRHLAKQLPNFMQPQVIHWRDAMPLNANGKIDRARLAREAAS